MARDAVSWATLEAFPAVKSDLSFWWRSLLAAVLMGMPLVAHAAPAEIAESKLDQVKVGVGGVFKVGRWTLLTAQLGSRPVSARLEVEAPDPEGSVVTYRGEPVVSKENGHATLSVLFKMGRLAGTIHARVVADGQVLLNRQLRILADPDADLPSPRHQSIFLIGYMHSPSSGGPGAERRPR